MTSQQKREAVQEVIRESNGKVYSAPCQAACPLGVDIQRSHVLLSHVSLDDEEPASRQLDRIGDNLYEKNPLFPIAGYICGLCEQGCNYENETGAVRRQHLVRFVADNYLDTQTRRPSLPRPNGDRIAVIGGGPGGLMAAYSLSKQGYRVTIFERDSQLGGALNLIPRYRLPREVLLASINNLIRIARLDIRMNAPIEDEKDLQDLKNEGYKAAFIATGTPNSRPLSFDGDVLDVSHLEGVIFGLDLLSDVNQGKPYLFQGKRVLVIGGGNVAFDTARVAKRLGGNVSLVCLEQGNKDSKDGIPADEEEVTGASQERIDIIYGRGVQEVIGENGKFSKIRCPRCTSVFDDDGHFHPEFDRNDILDLNGDILLVAIGQGSERGLFERLGIANDRGRVDVNPLTLQSKRTPWVFVGGDVRRPGFATEAMQEGAVAAEFIDRYLNGNDISAAEKKEYETSPLPALTDYKPQPEPRWKPASERLNFDMFEEGFTLRQAIKEATRCLYCGPCMSCKACVLLEIRPDIPEIEVDEDRCSGCGVCVSICPYDAASLRQDKRVAVRDDLQCKRCGICVAACPSGAVTITDNLTETVTSGLAKLRNS